MLFDYFEVTIFSVLMTIEMSKIKNFILMIFYLSLCQECFCEWTVIVLNFYLKICQNHEHKGDGSNLILKYTSAEGK